MKCYNTYIVHIAGRVLTMVDKAGLTAGGSGASLETDLKLCLSRRFVPTGCGPAGAAAHAGRPGGGVLQRRGRQQPADAGREVHQGPHRRQGQMNVDKQPNFAARRIGLDTLTRLHQMSVGFWKARKLYASHAVAVNRIVAVF